MSHTEKKHDQYYEMANAPISHIIPKLAAPTIVSMLISSIYNMADTFFVSQLGTSASGAVGVIFSAMSSIQALAFMIGMGSGNYMTRSLGAGKRELAEQIVSIAFFTGINMGLVITVSATFNIHRVVLLLGATETIAPYAEAYAHYIFITAPFMICSFIMNNLLRFQGKASFAMVGITVGGLLNIALDPLFIFGFHWSVAGAAGASLISRMTACFILMWRLRDPKLDIRIGTTKGVNMRMVKQILHIGIPNGIENSIFQLGRVLTVSIIAMFGTTQIAANAIANNLDSMGVLPGTAMSLAIITVIGRCVGAGDFEQAEYYAKKMMKLTYVINGICCLVVILTMPVTLRLYGVSGETRHLGAVLALIHNGCAIFLWPAGFCLPNVMRAANDVKFPMCVSIASMFIFRIGLSYVTGVAMGLGAIGVWIAMIIDWIVRISFFVTRFFSGKWKTFYHGE